MNFHGSLFPAADDPIEVLVIEDRRAWPVQLSFDTVTVHLSLDQFWRFAAMVETARTQVPSPVSWPDPETADPETVR